MISLVIPCFNEAAVLELTYSSIVAEAWQWDEPIEMLFVDDGSSDDTWSIIETLADQDPRVRGLRLSRNFGHQAAMGAGLEQARGEAVVVLDADLQDPPNLIEAMLVKWREGYDVVYAQRNRRLGESRFKRWTASWFYRLQEKIGSVPIPRDTGDFALMDAKVAKTLVKFREHALFWRGLRGWSGFKQTAVTFDRPQRAAGETKYTFRKMLRLASIGLLSFSELPLRFVLHAGLLAAAITGLAAVASVAAWCFGPPGNPLIATSGTLAMCFLGSVQLICLGVMGEYLNRIYDEVRDRPRWIISESVGALERDPKIQVEHRRVSRMSLNRVA